MVRYRAHSASSLAAGKPDLRENVAEDAVANGVPVPLVFTGAAEEAPRLHEQGDVVVWTEPEVLDTLM